MNILTTRFGLIQACETDVILIPEGLLGFRSFTHYIHLPDPVANGLSWLQSLTAPELAFGLVAPPWRSATTGSSFARATGRHSNWKTKRSRTDLCYT